MTNEELERLEALARAATPGPWHELVDDRILARGPNPAIPLTIFQFWTRPKVQDATYIAAANPAAILSLIQRVREAERLLKIESGIRYAAQQNFLNAFANGHASGRAEALEEAAKVAEGGKLVHRRHGSEVVDMDADEIATAIRALGEKAG